MKFIIILFFIVFSSCKEKAEKEKFYIPDNFTGEVFIFFNQKNGTSINYKDGFRIYKIPETGILTANITSNPGFLKDPKKNCIFYFVNEIGKTKQILVRYGNQNIDSNEIYVLSKRLGSFENVEYFNFKIDKLSNLSSRELPPHTKTGLA